MYRTLSEEQKAIASDPTFMGIEYFIFLRHITQEEDGEQQKIVATLSFEHGDDLYDCEDYNEVGGLLPGNSTVGCFAILNPSSEYTSQNFLILFFRVLFFFFLFTWYGSPLYSLTKL